MTYPTVDQVIEMLDDKIVRTDQGSFIKVDDLKDFHRQIQEASLAEKQGPKPKTMAEAKTRAKADPTVQAMFPPQPPRAPALSSVKGVAHSEEE